MAGEDDGEDGRFAADEDVFQSDLRPSGPPADEPPDGPTDSALTQLLPTIGSAASGSVASGSVAMDSAAMGSAAEGSAAEGSAAEGSAAEGWAGAAPSVRAVARRPATALPALGRTGGVTGRPMSARATADRRRRAVDPLSTEPVTSEAITSESITTEPMATEAVATEAVATEAADLPAVPEPRPEWTPDAAEPASPAGPQPEPAPEVRPAVAMYEPEPVGEPVPVLRVDPPGPGRHAVSPRAGEILDAAFRDSQTDEWIVPVDRGPSNELVPRGPSVLAADSWETVPPPVSETDYQGRRRAGTPASRRRLIAAIVLVAAALAVAIPWALTLGGQGAAVGPSPTLAGSVDPGRDSSDPTSPTEAPSASALPAVGASPLQPSERPAPPAEPSPTPPPTEALLSRGRPTATSALENSGTLGGANAVDGDPATRWGSAFADPEWVSVDLGSVCSITRVRLSWEAAYARSYEIQTSADNTTWTTAYGTTGGDGGVDEITVTATGRWVRILGTQRATQYGYSLWELEIFGTAT